MIIKSHVRGGLADMRDYLENEGKYFGNKGKNEVVRVIGSRNVGCDPKDINSIFREIWLAQPTGRNALKTPVHHISVNPDKSDRKLTDDEVWRIIDELAKTYGYDKGKHQMIVVEHVLAGRQHFHIVFNRVNLNSFRGVWPGEHWKKSMLAARKMEKELGLKISFAPTSHETANAAALGKTIPDIDKLIHAAFKQAKTGQEFIEACVANGLAIGKSPTNAKGSVTLLARDRNGGLYRIMPSLMRSDVTARKKQLDALTKDLIDQLPEFMFTRRQRGILDHILASLRFNHVMPHFNAAKSLPGKAVLTGKIPHNAQGAMGGAPGAQAGAGTHASGAGSGKTDKDGGEEGKGKTDGSGGGMGAVTTPYQSSSKDTSAPKPTSNDNIGKGNGPERRKGKKWVAVERRRQP